MNDVTVIHNDDSTSGRSVRMWLRRYRWRLVAIFAVAIIVALVLVGVGFVQTRRTIQNIESLGAGVRVEPDISSNETVKFWLAVAGNEGWRIGRWCRAAVQELRGFGTIRDIAIISPQRGAPNAGLWSNDPDVFNAALLSLAGRQSATFAGVRGIHISDSPLSDEGLLALDRCRSLTHLSLYAVPNVTSRVFARTNLPTLQSLCLAGENFTDESLSDISKMRQLTHLMLYETAVTEAGLEQLAGHPNLRGLDVRRSAEFSDAVFRHFTDMPRLCALNVHVSNITDAGVLDLRKLEHLEIIDIGVLGESGFSEARLQELRSQLRQGWLVLPGGLFYQKSRRQTEHSGSQ